jgi:hypothetical protein
MGASLLLATCWLAAGSVRAEDAAIVPVPARSSTPVRDLVEASPGVKIDPAVIPVQMRQPRPGVPQREDYAFTLPADLPGPDRLFRLDSESALIQRMKQESRERRPEEPAFPQKAVLTTEPYYGRSWKPRTMLVEPAYVCHGKLLFEQINIERYGWEVGLFQPLLSTAAFFKDFALLPMHAFAHPCVCYDCSAGKCLPGDPVPFLLYPPDITVSGVAAELGTIAGLMAIFP